METFNERQARMSGLHAARILHRFNEAPCNSDLLILYRQHRDREYHYLCSRWREERCFPVKYLPLTSETESQTDFEPFEDLFYFPEDQVKDCPPSKKAKLDELSEKIQVEEEKAMLDDEGKEEENEEETNEDEYSYEYSLLRPKSPRTSQKSTQTPPIIPCYTLAGREKERSRVQRMAAEAEENARSCEEYWANRTRANYIEPNDDSSN